MAHADIAPGTATHPTRVAPLHCPGCGSAVPLGDGDTLTCPYCRASVSVPESYGTLRAATRIAEADRVRVEAAYATLGAPPGPMLRFWAAASRRTLVVAAWVLLLPLAPALLAVPFLAMRLARYAPSWGFNLLDVMGTTEYVAVFTLGPLVLLVLPVIVYGYENTVAGARASLGAALAARPAAIAGGQALCRECGAPLEVPSGALGTRCGYCGTDNLLQVSAARAAAYVDASGASHRSAESALEALRTLRKGARGRLARRIFSASAIFGLLVSAWLAMTGPLWGLKLPPFRDAIAAPMRTVMLGRLEPLQRAWDGQTARVTSGKGDCNWYDEGPGPTWCYVAFHVPLHAGETFEASSAGFRAGTTATAYSPWNDDVTSPVRVAYDDATHRGTVTLTAPYEGWFTVLSKVVDPAPDAAERKTPLTLDVALVTRPR